MRGWKMGKGCGRLFRLASAGALVALWATRAGVGLAAGGALSFSDVHPGDWYYGSVDDLATRGIVSGSDGGFHPNDPVTRAEFTKMAVAAFGYHYTVLQGKEPKQVFSSQSDAVTYASQFDHAFVRDNDTGAVVWNNYPVGSQSQLQEDSTFAHFSDVPYGTWYWPFVEGAWAAKVVQGVGPGQFAPNDPIERQDMATLLMNALRLGGIDPGRDVLQPFGDAGRLSSYAVAPVSMAVKLNIVAGDEKRLIHPHDHASRADAAVMVDKALLIPQDQLQAWQTRTIQQIEAVPQSVTLAPGERQKVVAFALRQDGAAVPVSVNWRVDGPVGTVENGEFVATQAGTGTLVGTVTTSDGRTLTTHIPVTVDASTPVQVELTVTPSLSLLPGNKARIQVTLRDPAGQLVPGEVDLNVSVSDPAKGSLDVTRAAVTGGTGDLGTFTAGSQYGSVQIRATIATGGWSGSGQVTLNIVKLRNPVDGKGLWGTWVEWGTDGYDPDRIVQTAKQAGARYLYLIVRNQPGQGTIRDESKAMLNAIVPKAHANGLAVIGVVYLADDPALDTPRLLTVARYTTPTGDRVDGLAADIEEAPTPETISSAMMPVRQALGPDYPIIAVTYPPHIGTAWQHSANYPWSTFGQYFTMISIMDYWHYRDKTYTSDEVRNEIYNEAKAAASLTGRPVEVIGQAYRMNGSDGSPFATVPTAEEVTAAMQAAKDAGAFAFSLYRWDTATADELNAFRNFSW
ncbi:MAG: S-layer homology domain-containing protein [Kyrpidia sp.]|nr:S-layer homology domain-containing protein [Kyrpidia sp.]